jgi:hypothetical protein
VQQLQEFAGEQEIAGGVGASVGGQLFAHHRGDGGEAAQVRVQQR